MNTTYSTSDETYLVIQIDSIQFAVPASQVLHITQMPHIKKIPQSHFAIPGVIKFRDSVVSVIDLRTFLGYNSLVDQAKEMEDMLEQRKSEHIAWLKELERCVKEGDEFKLGLDPTQCKFGKWFYSYKTENKSLQLLLSRFDQPHKTIHGIAEKSLELVKNGRQSEAMALINATRNKELKLMIELFADFEEAYMELNRGLVVVMWVGSQTIGFSVDSVSSVQRFKPLTDEHEMNQNVSNALKEYGEALFLHEGQIVYELRPERVSEEVTGVF